MILLELTVRLTRSLFPDELLLTDTRAKCGHLGGRVGVTGTLSDRLSGALAWHALLRGRVHFARRLLVLPTLYFVVAGLVETAQFLLRDAWRHLLMARLKVGVGTNRTVNLAG